MNDVNHIVKKSITKLSELQEELQELDSQLLVTQVSFYHPEQLYMLIDSPYHGYIEDAGELAELSDKRRSLVPRGACQPWG